CVCRNAWNCSGVGCSFSLAVTTCFIEQVYQSSQKISRMNYVKLCAISSPCLKAGDSLARLLKGTYPMQLQQQEKPVKQQLRTTIWQNGKPSIETSLEKLPETLNDPQALVWLDIQGDYKPSENMLRNVFKL